ncbi:hypothetical protein LguiA_013487 [Lonicera macranthoides]
MRGLQKSSQPAAAFTSSDQLNISYPLPPGSCPTTTPEVPTNPSQVHHTIASAFSAPTNTSTSPWFINSGASNNMTFDSTHFASSRPMHSSPQIHTADGSTISTSHIGSIHNANGPFDGDISWDRPQSWTPIYDRHITYLFSH